MPHTVQMARPLDFVELCPRQLRLLADMGTTSPEFAISLSAAQVHFLISSGYCTGETKTENGVSLYVTIQVHPGAIAKE